MDEITSAAVVILAIAGDASFGDPPNRFHPVAWMGTIVMAVQRVTPVRGKVRRFLSGLLLVSTGVIAIAVLGWWLQRGLRACPVVIAVVAQAILLKCTFSVRSLGHAANTVAAALREDNLPAARRHVAYHLVSRDVSKLDASQLSAATIESVAENTSDSVIAPLFYFAVAGLPGALVYRFVNTCDGMLGYRTNDLEWYGKTAARLDDLFNVVPARLTAFIMLLYGGLRAGRLRLAVAVWWRDRRRTASPNAGHPMSAAAGVLDVALEKNGHYLLGGGQPNPTVSAIDGSVALLWETAIVFVCVQSAALVCRALA